MTRAAGGGTVHCTHPCRTSPTQVSWSLDHKSAHAGTYEVRFFDEESYSLLRKVRVRHLEPLPGLQEGEHPPLPQPSPPCSPFSPKLQASRGLAFAEQNGRVGTFLTTRPTCHYTSRAPLLPGSPLFHDSGQRYCLSNPSPPHLAAPLTPASPLQAQRNNEDISVIPPLFTVSVDHRVSGLQRLPVSGRAGSTQQASPFLSLRALGGE